jgi:phage recombination protein Bet
MNELEPRNEPVHSIVAPTSSGEIVSRVFTRDQVQLIKRTYCKPREREATDDELALFIYQCERTGLNPFARQIFAVFRFEGRGRDRGEVMKVQTAIDGLRLIAERTGKYEGGTAPLWCGPDREWYDVWLDAAPPAAAKVGVWKTGVREATVAVARFTSYAIYESSGSLHFMWKKMPDVMIAKCAEALALRRAFPQELSGIYTSEEMAQAGGTDDTYALSPSMQRQLIEAFDSAYAIGVDPAEIVAQLGELGQPVERDEDPLLAAQKLAREPGRLFFTWLTERVAQGERQVEQATAQPAETTPEPQIEL